MTAPLRHPVAATRTDPLKAFELRCWARAELWAACEFELHEAVDVLQRAAERDGLIVSLSRVVAAGAPADLDARTRSAATVFERVLAATRPGASGAELYSSLARAYEDVGCADEILKHHQGGAIGYRAREWVAHPRSQETVEERQAFAWNPTVTGTKVEDTALVIGDRLEIVTATPDWPTIDLDGNVSASGVWRL